MEVKLNRYAITVVTLVLLLLLYIVPYEVRFSSWTLYLYYVALGLVALIMTFLYTRW